MPSGPRPLAPAMEEPDWENRSWGDLDEGCAREKQPAPDSPHETMDWDDDDDEAPQSLTEAMGRNCAVKPCHGGRFVRFTVRCCAVFEITAKYKAPIGYIGGGSYGTVCHAFDSDKGKQVAIKKIADAFVDATQAKLVLREVMLLRHMNHRNIVALTDMYIDAFNDVYIASDLIHTDMHKVIHSDKALSEDHCQSYMYQLLSGLKYLHAINVLHRDLKPNNLLLTQDGVLKICDFGQARTIRRRRACLTKRVGTLCYKSPEILLHGSAYNSAVDMWSVGCIFVELILRKPLFPGVNADNQLSLIFQLIGTPHKDADLSFLDRIAQSDVRRRPYHPRQSLTENLPGASKLAIDLAEKMLTFDPRQRITIEDALGHPYFKDCRDVSNKSVCPSPSCFDFEEKALSVEQIKDLIYNESLAFNPDFRKQMCGRNIAAWRGC